MSYSLQSGPLETTKKILPVIGECTSCESPHHKRDECLDNLVQNKKELTKRYQQETKRGRKKEIAKRHKITSNALRVLTKSIWARFQQWVGPDHTIQSGTFLLALKREPFLRRVLNVTADVLDEKWKKDVLRLFACLDQNGDVTLDQNELFAENVVKYTCRALSARDIQELASFDLNDPNEEEKFFALLAKVRH